MPIFHLSLKIGAKGKAAPHFNYITASEKYAAKRGVVHVEHGNMPLWASAKPAMFWEASDEFERVNGTAYRELEVSLPRELPLAQQVELARQLAREACGDRHAFSFAIHHAKASDGSMNPHVHLQFSERVDDGIERDRQHYFKRANKKEPEKGGCVKDRSWQASKRGKQKVAESSERLLEIRQSWETMCNKALAEFGSDARIDHRSNEARGIASAPHPKVGAKSWHLFQRTGEKNERYQRWEQVIASNNAIITSIASKPSAQERYHDALQELQTVQRQLAVLQPVRRPDKSAIIRRIAENQKPVRRLDDEIWQLEHVTIHKAYDAMAKAQCKRDAGSNFFMRAWNRFYYSGDYVRLSDAYEKALKLKADKTRERKQLIQHLSERPYALETASAEYARQVKEYQAYIRRKVELERDLQSAQRQAQTFKSALPQAQAQRRNDAGLHLSM